MVEYKDRLHAAMKARSCGTQELADAMGISYQAVRKAVLGLSGAFNAENNAKAAAYLRVSPDWLAANIGDMEPGEAPLQPVATVAAWPLSPDLLPQVLALDEPERLKLEGAMRLTLALLAAAPQMQGSSLVKKVLSAKPTASTSDLIKSKVK